MPMLVLAMAIAVAGTLELPARRSVAAQDTVQPIPAATLDALDPNAFSVSTLLVAPGQTIRITNRGVLAHSFVVLEWGLDIDLPTLETVEVTVPAAAQTGQVFTFFCNEPGHRELGQAGSLTIVTPEQARAAAVSNQQGSDSQLPAVPLQANDDFSFTPAALEVQPGQIIQVRNGGAIEHHFAVDEWDVNETIPPGEVKLVQVPEGTVAGQAFTFYCTVPGHQATGMEGTITIVAPVLQAPVIDGPPDLGSVARPGDLNRFVPNATILGPGWTQVRSGDARAVLPAEQDVSPQIFPGEGRGATFVGPAGSRATVIVLPFAPSGKPTNQVDDAILGVQLGMLADWETNLVSSERFDQVDPPQGCDHASRIEGVTKVYTLPGGSTVCQLRSAGVAIFVAVEGDLGGIRSVEAADQVIIRLLQVSSVGVNAR